MSQPATLPPGLPPLPPVPPGFDRWERVNIGRHFARRGMFAACDTETGYWLGPEEYVPNGIFEFYLEAVREPAKEPAAGEAEAAYKTAREQFRRTGSPEDHEECLRLFADWQKQINEQSENQRQPEPTGVEARVCGLERKLAEANAWKESALQVEASWDCQRVGKLLNLPLASDIRAGIEPGIRELQAKLAEAREALEAADNVLVLHGYGQNGQTRSKIKQALARIDENAGREALPPEGSLPDNG